MNKIVPLFLLAAACGDNIRPKTPEAPAPRAHDGTYDVVLTGNTATTDLPDCGLVMEGAELRLDVTTDPLHITVDGAPDEAYDQVHFEWSGDFAYGEWALVDDGLMLVSFVDIFVADDHAGNAVGLARLAVGDLLTEQFICEEGTVIKGRFTPAE